MTQTKFFALSGGMDLVTPAIATPPGRLVSCRNYESSPRGYRRVDGWERFDGRTKPSNATYSVLRFKNGTYIPTAGDVITGASSAKSARVLYTPSVYSGSPVLGTAEGSIPVTENTGLLNGEDVRFGSVPVGTIVSDPIETGATTQEEDLTWMQAARDHMRSKIAVVPGSGPIRGVWTYNGDVYAFRNNVAGNAGGMFKATPTGWQAVTFHSSLSFKDGITPFQVGEEITGSTSGAKATIRKVVLQDGDWTTDDGTGRLIVTAVTGTFQNNETILSPSAGNAKVDGTLSQITLPPGGRYQFDNHNFLATTGTLNMYGVNGVGYAFEYDGSTLTPIVTDEENDKPIRVAAHKDHLFLAYENGRILHSALFNPLNYEVVQGALLAGIGEEITDMVPTATGELAVFGRNKVAVLYGTNATNWNLVTLTNESGAHPWTTQLIGSPLYLDHIGVRSMDSTQAYGNFALGTKTQSIQPSITNKIKAGIMAVGSLRVRSKDSYRLFWSDGTGISIYFGRKAPESMFFDLGFAPTCSCSGEDAEGREVLFLGAENGYVYQLDSGTSADGGVILSYIRMPFNHVGSPGYDKRWHKAVVEIDASPQTQISVVYTASYGDIDLPEPSEQDFDLHGGGGFWDEASWDDLFWSSPVEGTADINLEAIGKNLSLVLISEQSHTLPHTVHGVTLYFDYRRLAR